MLSSIVLIAALMLSEAPAAPFARLAAPEIAGPGRPILLDAGESEGDELQWWVQDSQGASVEVHPIPDRKLALLLAPKPGTYQVFLTAIKKAPAAKHEAVRTITVGEATVPPPSSPPVGEPKAALAAPSYLFPGTAMVLDGRCSKGLLKWSVVGPRTDIVVTSPKDAPADSLAILFNPPSGRYTVKLTSKGVKEKAGPVVIHENVVVVNVTSKAPLVPVEAKSPLPLTNGLIHVTLVIDLNNVPPEYANLVSGEKIKPAQGLLAFSYWVRDFSAADFAHWNFKLFLDGFTDDASGRIWPKVSLPALILQNHDGQVLSCEPAPTTPDAVVAKVKVLRGL